MDIKYENWTIVKKLGTGSFGSVYEIERKDFGVYKAALKVISIPQHPEEINEIRSSGMSEQSISGYYSSMVEEIISEFALMAKLKGNTNIVSYEDHKVIPHENEIGWDIYIRMELLTPLDSYLQDHPLKEADIIRLGIGMCRALERCQKLNIIHRDIKPGNIFVSEQGDFKLGDFGIARTVERTSSNMSRKGTYNYMAPEVYNGMEYGRTVDIYSLGLVMYRLLNHNRTPFLPAFPEAIRFQDQEMALFKRINGTPLPYPNGVVSPLGDVILKACAFEPKDRFQSPSSFRHALEKILEASLEYTITRDLPPVTAAKSAASKTSAVPAPAKTTATVPAKAAATALTRTTATGAASSDTAAEETNEKKQKKPIFLLIGAVVIILVVLGLLLLTKKPDGSKKTTETETTVEEITSALSETTTEPPVLIADYTEPEQLIETVQDKLEGEGLLVEIMEKDGIAAAGTILTQSVAAGDSLQPGDTISFTVSKGNQLMIPSFYNKTLKKFKAAFGDKIGDITIDRADELVYDENAAPGRIVSVALSEGPTQTAGEEAESSIETEAAGETASADKPLVLKPEDVIYKGSVLVVSFNGVKLDPQEIIGLTKDEARTKLSELGLEVSETSEYTYSDLSYDNVVSLLDENKDVLSGEQLLQKGSLIILNLSQGAEPVYQEPVYQEPVYQEPVYQEPATTAAPPPAEG